MKWLLTALCIISANLFASEISNQDDRVQRLSGLRREDIAEHMTELYSHIFSVEEIQILSERFSLRHQYNPPIETVGLEFDPSNHWVLESRAQEETEEHQPSFNPEDYNQIRANLHIFDELGWVFLEGNSSISILLRNAINDNNDEVDNLENRIFELIRNAGITLQIDPSIDYCGELGSSRIDNVLESIRNTRANREIPQ